MVVQGTSVLLLGRFHCGKLPRQFLKSLLLKALLPRAAECSWWRKEGESSMAVNEARLLCSWEQWLEGITKDLGSCVKCRLIVEGLQDIP